jgi:hypothetical protein
LTQFRKDPHAISNYFDTLVRGVGHRGSSFTDVDAVTHDKRTGRFLYQEFKERGEPLRKEQAIYLTDLAKQPGTSVWCVRRLGGAQIEWYDVATRRHETIPEDEYRRRFTAWWADTPIVLTSEPAAGPRGLVSVDEQLHEIGRICFGINYDDRGFAK